MANPKAFCSHRSVDKPRVMEVFQKLREAGIDAWVDEWEILAGQDFVAQINRGLDECDVGLVFLSQASMTGKWQQAEIAALTTMAVEEGKPLIPVLLDQDTPVPPLLRSRSRLSHEQFDQLVDAIYGRTHKPPLGPALKESTIYPFVIRLRSIETGHIGISAVTETEDAIDEIRVRPGAAFVFSYMEFLRNRPFGSRLGGAKEAVTQREKDLVDLGRAVGKVVFPDTIALGLQELIGKASREGATVNLFFETPETELLSIPFEAARFEDGRAPSLEPGVRVARRMGGETATHDGLPGPLKILVAVGAPDEGKTKSSVLDLEAELQTIIDAVEDARRFGNAYVKILEVAYPDEITKALRERSYHVLHLSGHGYQGVLKLEDEDGNPVQVTAEDLANALLEAGRPLPLVFLSACHSGTGDSETTSLAQGLLEKGVPTVLAMQAAVSDWYAIQLARRFYTNLTMSEIPTASAAIALARREMENERKKAATGADTSIQAPEYATPSLFFRGEETPLLDWSQPIEPVREKPRPQTAGAVPLLKIGDLVGRREEVRTMIRVFTGDKRAVERFGEKVGCVLTGIGGVGKSTVAGRVMERLASQNWCIAALSGAINPGELSIAVGSAALASSVAALRALAKPLCDETLGDEVRLNLLSQILANHHVLLVLDNFEDNLTLGGGEYRDAVTARWLQAFCSNARIGRLLVTSRYPLPESEAWLVPLHLGPLSFAQTAKLLFRHPRLRVIAPESVKLVQRVIGGHPRMIEYLDGILNRGRARLAAVESKLRNLAREQNIDLDYAGDGMTEAIRKALDVGAADILLDELLAIAAESSGDYQVLLQASVFPMPIPQEGLVRTILIGGAAADAVSIREVVRRLADLSLLTRIEGDYLWVHRWTAEALYNRTPRDDYQTYCRNGGAYMREQAEKTRSIEMAIESVRLLLNGKAWEESMPPAWSVVSFLKKYGRVSDLASFCHEVTEILPPSHADWSGFAVVEADSLRKLGIGSFALQRYQKTLDIAQRMVDQEPERADYLHDLLLSYEKMGDLQSGLGQGETARQYFQKALEIAKRLVDQEPERSFYLRSLSVSYNKMGDLLRDLGEGEAAGEYYQKDLDIAQRLVEQEPERIDYLRDLSVSYEKMGDLQSGLGQGETARQYCQKALDIRHRLVEQEPERTDYLHDLSVSYDKMGDLLSSLGQGETARQYYQKFLDICQRLVDQEPERTDYLRDLSISYDKMGALLSGLGQVEAALQYCQKALDIHKRLVDQEPERTDYLRDLSLSYNMMGDLLRGLGESETARKYYQKALDIAQRLVDQDPDRSYYLRSLLVSYNRMGNLLYDLGQDDAAIQYYQKALDIGQRLVEKEPERTNYLNDLSVSCERMGVLLSSLGQGEAAGQYCQKALDIAQRLVEKEPERTDYLYNLGGSYDKMGDLLSGLGQGETAHKYCLKALDIAQRLVEKEPERTDYLYNLGASYTKMGNLLYDLGEGEAARQHYQKALDICQRLVDQEPERADYLRYLSIPNHMMGDLLYDLGEGEAARQYYQKALDIAERLVGQEPERTDYLSYLGISYNKMGDLLSGLGQGEAACQYCQKALGIYQRLVDQEPERADYLRDLSLSYNMMGDLLRGLGESETSRKYYQKPLGIAKRLVDQEPERAEYLRDLWASYNKMGDLLYDLEQDDAADQYYQKALDIAQQLVDQEPERTDYLRDLWVSYYKMGNLLYDLEQDDAADQYYQKALDIAQRLVDQEPDRADYQIDLVVSLARIGGQEALKRGFTILNQIKTEGRLAVQDETRINAVEELLANGAGK